MDINKLTQKSREAVQDAQALTIEYGNMQIEQAHLLYALLAQLAGGTGTSEPTEGKPFSMGGNMKTVDLLYSKATNKQFQSDRPRP